MLGKVDWELLKIFKTVAAERSMTRAAEKLCVTQPAVSHAIRQLEEQLGFILFHRTRKQLSLTAEGEILFREVTLAHEHIEAAQVQLERLHSLATGELRIISPFYQFHTFLLPYLEVFTGRYPGISIHVGLENRRDGLLKALEQGEADIALMAAPDTVQLPDWVVGTPAAKFRYVFTVSEKFYKRVTKSRLSLSDINSLPLISIGRGNNIRDHMERIFAGAGLKLRVSTECDTLMEVEDFARIGMGVGLTMRQVPRGTREDTGLIELDVTGPVSVGRYTLLQKLSETEKPAVSAFMSLFKNSYSA